jgi:starch-binding outer membrane protein SusE/F
MNFMRIKNILFLPALLALVLDGCKKDITPVVLQSPAAVSGFTSSASTVELSNTNDSMTVADFKWQAPDYGFSAAVTYTLLFDSPADTSGANAWAAAIKINVPVNSVEKSFLGTDFNKILNQLGLPFGVASTLVVRLTSDIKQSTGASSTVPTINSTLSMTVTPYKIVLLYPKLFVAGDFLVPNWTQINQGGWILASVKSDGVYEGYVNFPNTGNNFKLCTEADWNGTNYGWGGSGTTISGSGSAGNCYFGGPGYTRVSTDVNALTISYTPTSWFVAGDFNSWSTTATPMTFNTTTNQWTAAGVTLAANSSLKFVSNSDWNNSYGLDSKGNFVFGTSSGNITAASSGTFTITLDLSGAAGNYFYSIK